MSTKHTPGPWFSDAKGAIWRRHPSELYENGGAVAGDKPLATANRGWFQQDSEGYPVEANARLIAAAPDLLEALQALFAQSTDFYRQDRFIAALDKSRAAILKATGEQT